MTEEELIADISGRGVEHDRDFTLVLYHDGEWHGHHGIEPGYAKYWFTHSERTLHIWKPRPERGSDWRLLPGMYKAGLVGLFPHIPEEAQL